MIAQAGVLKQKLLEKITELPQARLQEVLDFVDFLKSSKPRVEDPILHVSGCLSGRPLSAREIEEELYGKEPA